MYTCIRQAYATLTYTLIDVGSIFDKTNNCLCIIILLPVITLPVILVPPFICNEAVFN